MSKRPFEPINIQNQKGMLLLDVKKQKPTSNGDLAEGIADRPAAMGTRVKAERCGPWCQGSGRRRPLGSGSGTATRDPRSPMELGWSAARSQTGRLNGSDTWPPRSRSGEWRMRGKKIKRVTLFIFCMHDCNNFPFTSNICTLRTVYTRYKIDVVSDSFPCRTFICTYLLKGLLKSQIS